MAIIEWEMGKKRRKFNDVCWKNLHYVFIKKNCIHEDYLQLLHFLYAVVANKFWGNLLLVNGCWLNWIEWCVIRQFICNVIWIALGYRNTKRSMIQEHTRPHIKFINHAKFKQIPCNSTINNRYWKRNSFKSGAFSVKSNYEFVAN